MKKIGLALGGGAGLGWAHIGILRALGRAGIHINAVAGTSIGSIVGAAHAAGKLDDLEELARSVTFRDMVRFSEFGFRSSSVIGSRKLEAELRRHFGHMRIEEMAIPFAAVAADIYTGNEVAITSGDVVTALRASFAVPGLLPAVKKDNMLLVDGGVVNPVPVNTVRSLGAEFIIAVDLQGDFRARVARMGLMSVGGKRASAVKMARAGLFLSLSSLGKVRMNFDKADHIITPSIGHIEIADFTKADQLIKLGEGAAEAALPEIVKELAH